MITAIGVIPAILTGPITVAQMTSILTQWHL